MWPTIFFGFDLLFLHTRRIHPIIYVCFKLPTYQWRVIFIHKILKVAFICSHRYQELSRVALRGSEVIRIDCRMSTLMITNHEEGIGFKKTLCKYYLTPNISVGS